MYFSSFPLCSVSLKSPKGWGFPGSSVVKNPFASSETLVWSLICEDPICHRVTKPVHHSYWACALESRSCNYWAHVLHYSYWSLHTLEPMLCNKRRITMRRIPPSQHTTRKNNPLTATRGKLKQQRRPGTAKAFFKKALNVAPLKARATFGPF